MSLEWVRSIILDYGDWFYVLTFLWTFIEGETFVIYAGVLVSQGLLDGPLLLTFAWLGSFCGDQLYFFIGRRYGQRLLTRYPTWRPRLEKVETWLRRNDTVFILSFRWLYGIRNFASIGLGMSNISWGRFLRLNFVAAGIWATGFVGLGLVIGRLLRPVLEQVASYFTLAMLGLFVAMFGVTYLVHRLQSAASRRSATETVD